MEVVIIGLLKTNDSGEIQWQNSIGGSGDDFLYCVQQTVDGGYILVGESSSNISGDKTENCLGWADYWVVKMDAGGVIQWQNTIGGDDYEIYNLLFKPMMVVLF